jgi:hypothetical protein
MPHLGAPTRDANQKIGDAETSLAPLLSRGMPLGLARMVWELVSDHWSILAAASSSQPEWVAHE